jgi:hypothetical protein
MGAILFAINHLDEVFAGKATVLVWIKGALSCLVPFVVSNVGLLIAARRPAQARFPSLRRKEDSCSTC